RAASPSTGPCRGPRSGRRSGAPADPTVRSGHVQQALGQGPRGTRLSEVARVRTVEAAAAVVDDVGLATLFPKADVAPRSLWEGTAGPGRVEWGVQDPESGKWDMTPEFGLVWGWKDDLPARRLAAAGKHCGSFVLLVAPRLLPSLYAVTGRS